MCEIRAKLFLEGTSMCAQTFLVCARLTACVRTFVHSLEGTLMASKQEKTCNHKVKHQVCYRTDHFALFVRESIASVILPHYSH